MMRYRGITWRQAGLMLLAGGTAGAARAGSEIDLSAATGPDPLSRVFTITQEKPKKVRLICDESGGGERHQRQGLEATSQQIVMHGFKPATTYTCVAEKNASHEHRSDPVSFTTAALPADLYVPTITVPSSDPAATGYTLFNVGNVYGYAGQNAPAPDRNYLVILDAQGNVRW